MGIPFVPSLHPRDLFGRFRRKRGGPQKPKLKNRINPIKQAERVAERLVRREVRKTKIAARPLVYGSVRTTRRRRR